MTHISIDPLLKNGMGRFRLVIAAARRATELAAGEPPLVPARHKKLSTVALEEIAQKKVKIIPLKQGEKQTENP
jgi:DNA-directed RNA polymerase subunit omega